jgi:hypothetical protein
MLLQEASGLHRLRGWLVAGAIWITSLVCLLFLPWGMPEGSAGHMLVTLAVCAIVVMWVCVSQVRIYVNRAVSTLNAFAPPIGHLEVFLTRAALLSALFWTTGGLVLAIGAPIWSAEQGMTGRMLTTTAVNMGFVWLLLLGGVTTASCTISSFHSRKESSPVDFLKWATIFTCLAALTLAETVAFAVTTFGEGEVTWAFTPPKAFYATLKVATEFTRDYRYVHWPTHFLDAVPSHVLHTCAWALPVAILAIAATALVSERSGKAHPTYCLNPNAGQPPESLVVTLMRTGQQSQAAHMRRRR